MKALVKRLIEWYVGRPEPEGCYICQPDNPNASPEGCADCEKRFVEEVVIPAVALRALQQWERDYELMGVSDLRYLRLLEVAKAAAVFEPMGQAAGILFPDNSLETALKALLLEGRDPREP